ncbi:MAG: DUF3299 domain-containing protein [Planctomycetota bacterium]
MEGLPNRRRGESRSALIVTLSVIVAVMTMALAPACSGSDSEAPRDAPVVVKAEDLDIGSKEAHTGDVLADAVFGIIRDLVELKKTKANREELVQQLRLEVDRLGLGEVAKRGAAVTGVIDEIISQSERFRPRDGKPGQVTGQQRLFIVSRAQTTADRLRDTLKGIVAQDGDHFDHDPAPLLAPAIDEVDVPMGYLSLSWKTIANFEFSVGMTLPANVQALNGKKVGIAGYMMSLGEYENIREFLLVESAWACCFGIAPDVNQAVVIKLPDDEPGVDLVTLPILATGKLIVEEQREQDFVIGLYRMVADDVVEVD